MTSFSPLNQLIERFQQRTPIRASSLIVTLYGDAIEPRGGTTWMGSLIRLLEPVGINERLSRTSIYRLAKEGWLSADKVGRCSYYSLTNGGRRRFEKAFTRIYSANQPAWDGDWCLVILSQLEPETRKKVRQELEWQGFGSLAPTVLANPRSDRAAITATLQDLDALDDCIVFETHAQDVMSSRALRQQVRESWDIDELGRRYSEFIQLFRPVWKAISEGAALTTEESFLVRLLLIHEYRRLLLRDPQLPDELLPGDWEGRAARQLCRNIYRQVYVQAEQWLSEMLETAEGPVPDANKNFYLRFGGLRN